MSQTNHLPRSITPIYRSLYFGPTQIFKLRKSDTSLNRPLKVGPMVGRFKEVFLYSVTGGDGHMRLASVSRVGRSRDSNPRVKTLAESNL